MSTDKRIRILGVPVDMIDENEAMDMFLEIMSKDQGCRLIVTPNSEIIISASKDKSLLEIIEKADLILPDGIGLVYASKIMGRPLSGRVTGIDFLDRILAYLEKTGQSVFFLGSKPANEELDSIAEIAASKIKEKYPNLKVAGTHHGYFGKSDEKEIIEIINNSGADFLCVALGSPKQEKFINDNIDLIKAKAAIGVGGSLDVWAGALKRAPKFFRENGLEWLFRLIQEPRRYKRMAVLPLFMIKVVFSRFRGGK